MTELRDYQQEMLERIHRAWKNQRSVMVQMPTGTGKTHLMAAVIRERLAEGVLVVAHRRELIEQIQQTLQAFGLIMENGEWKMENDTPPSGFAVLPHDRMDNGEWRMENDTPPPGFAVLPLTKGESQVMVQSIQWLAKHLEEMEMKPGLIVVDEAHHALAKTYRMLWEKWPNAQFLGLTATPCRLNGAPFTDLFDCLLQSDDIMDFIRKGWLSDFEYVSVCPDSVQLDKIRHLTKRGADGDYQVKEMATVLDVPESVAHVFDSYRHYAWGKKGIVYAIDRTHAEHIRDCFKSHGVSCCKIEAATPAGERNRLVEAYREGRIDVIVNVDIFSEGFDCPEVEFIQLARPTLSLSKYMQQVGRGMRRSEGKDFVTILDQVGLYQTFGLPTENRRWDLMFRGVKAGKGTGMNELPIVIREGEMEKELVNLEMVRVKRHDERREGIEVFMQGGHYGVMYDGVVTCQAEFEHIKRLNGNYYALGVYPYVSHHGRTTVVDKRGIDLRVSLYGKVEQEGDFFKGLTIQGIRQYWDAKGGRYYDSIPMIERIGRMEVVRTGDRYRLRQQSLYTNFLFKKGDVLYNDCLTIISQTLIVKNNVQHPYRIIGYSGDLIIVDASSLKGCICIRPDGASCVLPSYPRMASMTPNLFSLNLKRAK